MHKDICSALKILQMHQRFSQLKGQSFRRHRHRANLPGDTESEDVPGPFERHQTAGQHLQRLEAALQSRCRLGFLHGSWWGCLPCPRQPEQPQTLHVSQDHRSPLRPLTMQALTLAPGCPSLSQRGTCMRVASLNGLERCPVQNVSGTQFCLDTGGVLAHIKRLDNLELTLQVFLTIGEVS